jgi:hypothetical protein
MNCRSITTILLDLEDVDTPSDTVEFNIGFFDLVELIDAKQVEAFDGIFLDADLWEDPVPEDIAARNKDAERLDVRAGVFADAGVPFVTA